MRFVLASEKPTVPSVSCGFDETVTSDTFASGSEEVLALLVVSVVRELVPFCPVACADGAEINIMQT